MKNLYAMKKHLKSLFLFDIGHTNAKYWNNETKTSIPIQNFTPEMWNSEKIFYINVNKLFEKKLHSLENWIDLSDKFSINTEYKTLGVDRKVVIFGFINRIIVDLGSAITVDIIKNKKHVGGYILLGKSSVISSFESKIPHLSFEKNNSLKSFETPQKSEDAMYYGFFHQLLYFLRSLQSKFSLEITLTGGDSAEFHKIFNSVNIEQNLIFKNMIKIIESNKTLI